MRLPFARCDSPWCQAPRSRRLRSPCLHPAGQSPQSTSCRPQSSQSEQGSWNGERKARREVREQGKKKIKIFSQFYKVCFSPRQTPEVWHWALKPWWTFSLINPRCTWCSAYSSWLLAPSHCCSLCVLKGPSVGMILSPGRTYCRTFWGKSVGARPTASFINITLNQQEWKITPISIHGISPMHLLLSIWNTAPQQEQLVWVIPPSPWIHKLSNSQRLRSPKC